MSGHINSSDLNYINYKQKLDAVLRQCKQHEIRMQFQRRNLSNQSRSKSRSQEKLNKPIGFNQNLSINTNFEKQQNCNYSNINNSNLDSMCNFGNETNSKRYRSITTTNSALIQSNSKKSKQLIKQQQQNQQQQKQHLQQQPQQQQQQQMNFSSFFQNQNKSNNNNNSKKFSNKHQITADQQQMIQSNYSSSTSTLTHQQKMQQLNSAQMLMTGSRFIQKSNVHQQQQQPQQNFTQICNQETDSANQICQLLQKLIQVQQSQERDSIDIPYSSSSNRFNLANKGNMQEQCCSSSNSQNIIKNLPQQQQQQLKQKSALDIRTSQKINPLEIDDHENPITTQEDNDEPDNDQYCLPDSDNEAQLMMQQQQNQQDESEFQEQCSTINKQMPYNLSSTSNQNLLEYIAAREGEIEKKYKEVIKQYIMQNSVLSSELAKMRQNCEGKENKVKELQNELRRLRKEKEEEMQKNSKLEESLLIERERNIEMDKKLEDLQAQMIQQKNNIQKLMKDNPETKQLQKQLQEALKEKEQLEDVLKNFLLERELQKMHEHPISIGHSNTESNFTATPLNTTQNIVQDVLKQQLQQKLNQLPNQIMVENQQQDSSQLNQSQSSNQSKKPSIKQNSVMSQQDNEADEDKIEINEQQHQKSLQQSNKQDQEEEDQLSRVDENEELFAFAQNDETNNLNPNNLNELLNQSKKINSSHLDSLMACTDNEQSKNQSERVSQQNTCKKENDENQCLSQKSYKLVSSKQSSQREPLNAIDENITNNTNQQINNSKKPSKQFTLDLSKLQSNITYQNEQIQINYIYQQN